MSVKYPTKNILIKDKTITLREAEGSDDAAVIDFLGKISEETPFTYNYPGQSLDPEVISKRTVQEKLAAQHSYFCF